MAKKYYETLGVSEKETPEEIKKSYRKLAIRWHPDKWSNKTLKEREQANEKMQELNKAFEILGDPELRKRYDAGETDFTDYTDDYERTKNTKQEELRKQEELLRAQSEIIGIQEKIWLLNAKHLDRSMTATDISAAFCFSFPRVRKENLDPKFWQPYQDWNEKVWEMEITISGNKDRSDELKNFKEEMVKAIKEAETALKIREENEKRREKEDGVNSGLNRARTDAFRYIEKEINEKGLKIQDLGQYSNYKGRINNLNKVYEIRDLREEVLNSISKLGKKPRQPDDRRYPPRDPRENPNYPPKPNPDPRFPDKPDKPKYDEPKEKEKKEEIETEKIDNFLSGFRDNKYDNWTHQELVDEIKREQLNNASLQKLVSLSEIRIEELEEEVRELKAELPQTDKIREGISKKEKQLNQWKQSRITLSSLANNNNNNNNNNNPWPIMPIIGGIGIIALLGLITYKLSRKRIRR